MVPGARFPRLRAFGSAWLDALANTPPGAVPPIPAIPGLQLGPGAPGVAAPPIDFARLNGVIMRLLQPLVANEPSIESLELAFDPAQSDLNADQLVVSAVANLRHTAWSADRTQLHVGLGIKADIPSSQAPIDARVTLSTAIAPFADFALHRYQSKAAEAQPAAPQSADDIFNLELREYLAQVQKISDFEDIVDVFQSICGLRFMAQNENIDRLKAAVDAAPDAASSQALALELQTARLAREKLSETQIRIVRDTSGRAQTISVKLRNVPVASALFMDQLDVELTPTQVTLAGKGRVVKGVEVYALAKPLVITTLGKVSQADPATLDAISARLANWLALALPFLKNAAL